MADDDCVESNRRIRALSFAGGAFDTVMQLGVAHALLVSDGRPPDHVVGISAGAINAAALAEIMQAGEELRGDQKLAARVRRLREFIDAYVEIPAQIVESTFPDTFEVNAQKALPPLELPIHFEEERKGRIKANRSRAGLIQLLNHLLRLRLTVAAATRMIRRFLAIRQSGELKRPKNFRNTRLWNYAGIWLAAGYAALPLSQILFTLLFAALRGPTQRKSDKRTAGEIILAFHWLRTLFNGAKAAAALAIYFFLWSLPILVILQSPPPWLKAIAGLPPFAHRATAFLLSWRPPYWSAAGGKILGWLHVISENVIEASARQIGETSATLFSIAATGVPQFLERHFASLVVALIFWLAALLADSRRDIRCRWFIGAYLVVMCAQPQRLFGLAAASVAVILLWALVPTLSIVTRILEYYAIGDGILSADVLKQELVKRFNSRYFGKQDVNEMIDAALKRTDGVNKGGSDFQKTLGRYQKAHPPIHVAPVAADLGTGKLEILTSDFPVVDALLAATAVSPLFPAYEIEPRQPRRTTRSLSKWFRFLLKPTGKRQWFIDGLNVSNEPIQPLLDHLRNEYSALKNKKKEDRSSNEEQRFEELNNAVTVDIYPVSDLPVDHSELPNPGGYSTLVEVGLRALELKQFRDATMERRLTRLYSKVLPRGKAFHDGPGGRTYIHAGLYPIELERPARVNRRLTRGTSVDAFRTILRATVADGCRAALEAMMPDAILQKDGIDAWAKRCLDPEKLAALEASGRHYQELAEKVRNARPHPTLEDRVVISAHGKKGPIEIELARSDYDELVDLVAPKCRGIIDREVGRFLPGSDADLGPGVAEICAQCRLFRPEAAATVVPVAGRDAEAPAAPEPPILADDRMRLRVHPERLLWPRWPRANQKTVSAPADPPPIREEMESNLAWPKSWPPADAADRPIVSFLFGGGVFRGVFHVGVMNALNEAGLQPDIVAGSSVGSIIAAMIASVFKEENATRRQRRIRTLAATFLSIDRFVLTDRLADFVRRLTLRAAESHFSPRDVDLLLRRYDIDMPSSYNRRTRNVIAGIERLLYVSPFELYTIVRAARLRDFSTVLSEVVGDIQELLDRGGVGQELLGSEPLSLLIYRHVSDPLQNMIDMRKAIWGGALGGRTPEDEPEMRFDSYLEGDPKIFFLATATNLVSGALQILGAPYDSVREVSLRYGLLASSAFPAIFRPRQAWEIVLGELGKEGKYIDGGVIDNLPLDAVARFLNEAARHEKINRRPATPHLLFTASLEVARDTLPMAEEAIRQTRRNFLQVRARAKTFQSNRKIDSYRSVQGRLNGLYTMHEKELKKTSPKANPPLSLTVIAVKPKWLCGTFAFHPMLGFQRRNQQRSIAHGCASTFATLWNDTPSDVAREAWRIKDVAFEKTCRVEREAAGNSQESTIILVPQKEVGEKGQCWFRTEGHLCPFSKEWRLKHREIDAKERPEELEEVDMIYQFCRRPETHEPELGSP